MTKRLLLLFTLFTVGVGMLFSYAAPAANAPLQDFSQKGPRKARKAQTTASMEGIWIFSFGDYYYEESEMRIIDGELSASFYDGILYFEDSTMEFLPMAATFDEETNTLTFNAGYFGDFGGYGILVQHPAYYDPTKQAFVQQSVIATYDPQSTAITFPENSGMTWWLYDYDYKTPIMEIWGYTFEKAIKKPAKKANQLIINKGKDNETTLNFNEFSRIDFKDGNVVFDNDDALTFPISDLYTVHFDENNEDLNTGVKTVAAGTAVLRYSAGRLAVEGLQENSRLDIYSISGARVFSAGNYNGETVDISYLPAGIYVVATPEASFKLVK